MRSIPSPIDTIRTLIKGYLPRVFQARGRALAIVIILPLILSLLKFVDNSMSPAQLALSLYHYGYAKIIIPIVALIAASACISEDLGQRTLPLMLVRPAPVWALPIGKGILWFTWCSIWLIIAIVPILSIGLDISAVFLKALALTLTFWAQLGFAALLLLLFKRGIMWAALFFLVWDPLLRVFPPALQRITFTHYLESIAGSRYTEANVINILAQEQITTPIWLGAIILIAVGFLAWGMCGLRLMYMPIGLAGRESEG